MSQSGDDVSSQLQRGSSLSANPFNAGRVSDDESQETVSYDSNFKDFIEIDLISGSKY